MLFWSYGLFSDNAPNGLTMILNTTRSKVPHISSTSIPESEISICFALWTDIFELLLILRECFEWPQNDLEHWGNPYSSTGTPESQISICFAPQPAMFHLEKKSAENHPKITLNTIRSKVPNIWSTSIPESQISLRYCTINHFQDEPFPKLKFQWVTLWRLPQGMFRQSFFLLTRIITVRGVALWYFPILHHFNFNLFWKLNFKKSSFKIPISNFCKDCHKEYLSKCSLKKNHNCERSSVLWKFSLALGTVFTKMKESLKLKTPKFWKRGKRNGLEIW